ncbi:MAG: YIP1 family protein [Lachnoclostridium sp.]|jgi:hypothetical protein|nr:YIP1 family protein [Lachnoclostridium sp.]
MKLVDAVRDKDRWKHTGKTLRYSLRCLTKPFDSFWDLTHEKRGSKSAATIILIAVLAVNILDLLYSSFVHREYPIDWNYVNIFMYMATIAVPLLFYVVGNWCLTTLFDGKGTMSDIYMGTCYALTPYVLIQLPLTFISNLVTDEEGVFIFYFQVFSLIWCGLLVLISVMMIHDFTLGKGLMALIFSIVAMMVIIFLIILFFSLITDAIAFFYSLYREISFRFY